MRALQAQLGDFEIANCLIKADRTHSDGKQSHERPRQRRATCAAAIQMPKAMILIEIVNENAAFMLASIPNEIGRLKYGL